MHTSGDEGSVGARLVRRIRESVYRLIAVQRCRVS